MMRPMFGAFGKAASVNSIAFVSKASEISICFVRLFTVEFCQVINLRSDNQFARRL